MMTTWSVTWGNALSNLRKHIESVAIRQFKKTSQLYWMWEHRTMNTWDHTYAFNIYNRDTFTPTQATLVEWVTPEMDNQGFSQVTVQMTQFGRWVILTDIAVKDNPFDLYTEAAAELWRQMAEVVDQVVQTKLLTLDNTTQTQVIYGANRASRSAITSTDYAKSTYFANANAILKSKWTPEIDSGYVAVAHPLVIQDLLTEVGSSTAGFFEAAKYSQPEKIFNGELGKMFGIRFVEASNIQPISVTNGTTFNVYPTFLVGKYAYGVVESQAMETIVKPIGSSWTEDPLNQRGSVGIKTRFWVEVLKPEANFRIETPVSLNPTLPY